MFTRRDALIGMALQCAASGFNAHAATSSALKRIGILSRGSQQDEDNSDLEQALFESLRSKGWVEEKNLLVVRAYSGERDELLPALAEDLVRSRVELILTGGHITTIAAARATSRIPIVFSNPLPFAVAQGLVESFARPGRNVTGATYESSGGKAAQFLRQLMPSVRRRLAAVETHLWTRVERLSGGLVDIQGPRREQMRAAGFETAEFFYRGDGDLVRVFAEIDQWQADAVAVSPIGIQDALQSVELARRRKLASLFPWRQPVEAGGLLSYGPALISAAALGRAAAPYVDRILRGADPATLPVEMPTRWELVINAKTAENLGLSIPVALQVSAEIVR